MPRSIPRGLAAAALVVLAGPLAAQSPPSSFIHEWKLTTYQLPVDDWTPQLQVEITGVIGNDADLYLRRGAPPTQFEYDAASVTPGTANELVILNATTDPALTSGTWYVGVWHDAATTTFDIGWAFQAVPSLHAGLGANVYGRPRRGAPRGTSFRVWAPNASTVRLAGDFNGWSGWNAPMAQESGGLWSLDVRDAGHGTGYKYVIRNGAQELWKNDPRARALTNSVGHSLVQDPARFDWGSGGFSMPAWDELVLYELHVGTFSDTPGGPVGTFAQARSRLPYLADLGVNAVELMPICEFAGDYSWGYNYGHPFSVESAYGGPTELKRFIREAHQHGIAVLLDVMYNHWGPSDLDLWQFDGWQQNGLGGIYFYNDLQAQTPWGDTRPDYGRPQVRQYIRDNALSWLNEFRVDGLRWDSTSFMRMGPLGDIADAWSLMQWSNDEIDASQGWKINIAEDMYNAPNEWITKATGAGGAGFDSQWDALFVHPIRAALIAPNDPDRDMWAVKNAILQYYNGDATERVIYTESHDEVANGKSRVPEEIWPGNAASWYSKKRSTLGAAIVMTAPGVPMIFQGQELLEDGHFADDDPLDWSKLTTFGGIHDLYRDLIHMRRNLGTNTAGLRGNHTNVHHVNDGDKVIAYHRWDQGGPGDDVVVLCNFANKSWSNYTIGLPQAGTWWVRFNSDWSGYDASFGNHPTVAVTAVPTPYDGLPYSASLSFAPYTAIVLSQ